MTILILSLMLMLVNIIYSNQQIMTLELRLTNVSGSPAPEYIYVDGGESGSLRLSARKLPQLIRCSRKAHLQFFLCGKQSEVYPQPTDVIATRDFWAESTIDQNREVWDDQKPHEYKMEYYNQKHERIGYMTFQVTYSRGLFYQGELQGAESISRKMLPFYKSRCPTHNLYNCLDSRDGPSTFNFVEDIYRDA